MRVEILDHSYDNWLNITVKYRFDEGKLFDNIFIHKYFSRYDIFEFIKAPYNLGGLNGKLTIDDFGVEQIKLLVKFYMEDVWKERFS